MEGMLGAHVGLEDPEVERIARERGLAAGYRAAARRALGFARRYRNEEGSAGGEREKACIAQAREWRLLAHRAFVPKPGLARTRPDEATESGDVKTG